jgi:DNA-binding beta-propeller fold protein YncE
LINTKYKIAALLTIAALWACEEPKPLMSGRLSGPTDLEVIMGCPEALPECGEADKRHLLLVTNSREDSVRIFDVLTRSFFKAPNPLFPFSIQVGQHPRSLVVDPLGRFGFVVNSISEDVSVIDLAPENLYEVDTDEDKGTCFCGPGECGSEDPSVPQDDRCRAGVSRVALSPIEGCQPEDIVTIKDARLDDTSTPDDLTDTIPWLDDLPLPVFVSLPGCGQVVELEFLYPGYDQNPDHNQHMQAIMTYNVTGQPSGMEITSDGALVFVADEASDSIVVIDTALGTFSRVNVGGPSRRLALTPDESVLYVVRTDDSLISLVDVATLTKIRPGVSEPNSTDPEGLVQDLGLPGIPRSVTFTSGMANLVLDESNATYRDYTKYMLSFNELADIQAADKCQVDEDCPENSECTKEGQCICSETIVCEGGRECIGGYCAWTEPEVKTYAYVSNLNSQIYVIDAENHRVVDIEPFIGAVVSGQPVLTIAGEAIEEANWITDCPENGDCPYPQLVGFGAYYEAPRDADGHVESCSNEGSVALVASPEDPEVLVPTCVCNSGFHAVGRECIPEGFAFFWHNYHGILVRSGVTRTESWTMIYEGVIPGTERSSSGSFSSFRFEDNDPQIDFIVAGVQVGDYLQILSAPSVISREPDDPCRKGSGPDERTYDSTDFEVLVVDTNSLELKPAAGLDPSLCWPEAVRYQVRVKQAWTVWGSASGIHPRLKMIPYTDQPPDQPAYDNGLIALTMLEPTGWDPNNFEYVPVLKRDDTWTFITNDGFIATKFAPSAQFGAAGDLLALNIDEDENADKPVDDRIFVVYEGSNALLEFFPFHLDPSNFLYYQ